MQHVLFLLSSGCLELTVFRRPSVAVAVPSAVAGATPAAAAAAAVAAAAAAAAFSLLFSALCPKIAQNTAVTSFCGCRRRRRCRRRMLLLLLLLCHRRCYRRRCCCRCCCCFELGGRCCTSSSPSSAANAASGKQGIALAPPVSGSRSQLCCQSNLRGVCATRRCSELPRSDGEKNLLLAVLPETYWSTCSQILKLG